RTGHRPVDPRPAMAHNSRSVAALVARRPPVESPMRTTWTFHTAGQLIFGRGATDQLGDAAVRQGVRRMLVVTDANLLAAGLTEPVHTALSEAGVVVEVYSGGQPEPSTEVVLACVAAARAFRPDSVLGLGGGSNLDLAKATSTLLAHGGSPLDYSG